MTESERKLRIAYLLADSAIAGGTRVAAAHADALVARGHEAVLVSCGARPTWRETRAPWVHVESLESFDASGFDFVVGTFWTTLANAYAVARNRAFHFCQGYEGSFTAYRESKSAIEAAYRLPLPKITVSPHLVALCREFYDDATYIGQIVDDVFFQARGRTSNRVRVLLVGPYEADFKGIDTGYEAVRVARREGLDFDLVRVSQWEPAPGEPVDLAAEFHSAIDTRQMAELIASCDVFVAPSRREEGFGLPAAEAMASGLPGVVSRIPSFSSWNRPQDYALFADEGDARAMGLALASLLRSPELQAQLARRARQVVEQFRPAVTGERVENYFLDRAVSASARTRTSG